VLALLGIVIGVGTVIGMVSLINGFQRSFQQNIQSFGNNTLYIRRIRPASSSAAACRTRSSSARRSRSTTPRRSWPSRPAVARCRVQVLVQDIKLSLPGRTTKTTFIYGTNEELPAHPRLRHGARPVLHREEVRGNANVVVLGKDTREALFKDASGLGGPCG
jgi:putative ABC transport system permease protein